MNYLDNLKFQGETNPSEMNYVEINKGKPNENRGYLLRACYRKRVTATIIAAGRDSKAGSVVEKVYGGKKTFWFAFIGGC